MYSIVGWTGKEAVTAPAVTQLLEHVHLVCSVGSLHHMVPRVRGQTLKFQRVFIM